MKPPPPPPQQQQQPTKRQQQEQQQPSSGKLRGLLHRFQKVLWMLSMQILTSVILLGLLLHQRYVTLTDDTNQYVNSILESVMMSTVAEQEKETKGRSLSLPQEAIVPLQGWEISSMNNNPNERICQPPSHYINCTYCCLGSISGGGETIYTADVCNRSIDDHHKLAHYTSNYLQQYLPIPQHDDVDDDIDDDDNNMWQLPHQDCDICRLVDYLQIYNWTLSFQGDSMMRQTFTGFECELRRRGYIVYSHPQQNSDYPMPRWNYGIRYVHTITVSLPPTTSLHDDISAAPAASPRRHQTVSTTTIHYFSIYRPIEDGMEIQNIVLPHTDILVFDHGLHYGASRPIIFYHEMNRILPWYRNKANYMINETYIQQSKVQGEYTQSTMSRRNLTLLAWREPPSQHFNKSGGYYPDGEYHVLRYGCVPHASLVDNQTIGFHRPLMEKAATNNHFTIVDPFDPHFRDAPPHDDANDDDNHELVILPFRHFTSEIHYLHNNKVDCTHFCHDPHEWLPIWRSLRLALDRKVIQIIKKKALKQNKNDSQERNR